MGHTRSGLVYAKEPRTLKSKEQDVRSKQKQIEEHNRQRNIKDCALRRKLRRKLKDCVLRQKLQGMDLPNTFFSASEKQQQKWLDVACQVDQIEQDLNKFAISDIHIDAISCEEVNTLVRNIKGKSNKTIIGILLHMARTGYIKHRKYIFDFLRAKINNAARMQRERASLSAQPYPQPDNRVPTQKEQYSQFQQEQPISFLTLRSAEYQQKLAATLVTDQPYLVENADVDAGIVAIARLVKRHSKVNCLSVVQMATIQDHSLMHASFCNAFVKLALENTDLTAISLLIGFRLHKNIYWKTAGAILQDYINETLLAELFELCAPNRVRDLANDALDSAQRSSVSGGGNGSHSGLNGPKRSSVQVIFRSERGTTNSAAPPLSVASSVSSPASVQDQIETDDMVQIWQLSSHEQEMQSRCFGLVHPTDTVRCIYCLEYGHVDRLCPAIPTTSAKQNREHLEDLDSTAVQQNQVPLSDASTAPLMVMANDPALTPVMMRMSCYNCGSSTHWGDECHVQAGIVRH